MKCPRCSSENLSVLDSRADGEAIRRRRTCGECEARFTTFERVEYNLPLVVKKDGRREEFSRDKIRAGILRACEKRPVSIAAIDEAVERIEKRIQESLLKEIDSRGIGEMLMDELRVLDKIAYVRFASVYREFSDVSQFVDTLESLEAEGAPGTTTPVAEDHNPKVVHLS
jgi:transcriptional repressor NrdR